MIIKKQQRTGSPLRNKKTHFIILLKKNQALKKDRYNRTFLVVSKNAVSIALLKKYVKIVCSQN
jgi:hypothetical protein